MRPLCPWGSPGQNTGVGCHFLLQRISTTQGSHLGLLHCRQILYHLSYREVHLQVIAESKVNSASISRKYVTGECGDIIMVLVLELRMGRAA